MQVQRPVQIKFEEKSNEKIKWKPTEITSKEKESRK